MYVDKIQQLYSLSIFFIVYFIFDTKSRVFLIKKIIIFVLSYPLCSGSMAPGKAADLYFKKDVIAFIGPACAFALEPVAKLASYWKVPIITGIGDQVCYFGINRLIINI